MRVTKMIMLKSQVISRTLSQLYKSPPILIYQQKQKHQKHLISLQAASLQIETDDASDEKISGDSSMKNPPHAKIDVMII